MSDSERPDPRAANMMAAQSHNQIAKPLFPSGADLQASMDMEAGFRTTGREREILQILAEGLSAKEVALRLNLAPKTVECHIERIRLKANARNRLHMIVIALTSGLINAPS